MASQAAPSSFPLRPWSQHQSPSAVMKPCPRAAEVPASTSRLAQGTCSPQCSLAAVLLFIFFALGLTPDRAAASPTLFLRRGFGQPSPIPSSLVRPHRSPRYQSRPESPLNTASSRTASMVPRPEVLPTSPTSVQNPVRQRFSSQLWPPKKFRDFRDLQSLQGKASAMTAGDPSTGTGDGTRQATAVEVQKAVLLAFKTTVTKDPTGVLDNWKASDPSPCVWTGVMCPVPGRVSALNLTSRGLVGRLDFGPPDISRLPFLRSLLLSGNSLWGVIPSSIGQNSMLEAVLLSGNSVGGTLPPSLAALRQLTQLSLDENGLTGSLPLLLGTLTQLRIFTAVNNSLQGTFPTSFSRLTSLVRLRLDMNKLTGPLSPLLGQAPTEVPLVHLGLQANNFSGGLPEGLGLRTRLTSLDLSQNSVDGMVPSFIANLASLQALDLSRNALGGSIPYAVNNLRALSALDLSSNQLSGSLPLNLALLTSLTSLNVSYNNLSGTVPSTGVLGRFPQSSFTGNPALCFQACNPPPLPPVPAAPPVNGSGPCPPGMSAPPPHHVTVIASPPAGMSPGTVVAIVVAAGGSLILLTALVTIYLCTSGYSDSDILVGEVYGSEGGGTSKPSLPSAADFLDEGPGHMLTMFDDSKSVCLSDVMRATDQLGDTKLVGAGGTGAVYRAQLPNGRFVAVKKLKGAPGEPFLSPVKFKETAQLLGSLRHEHILPLLGFWANQEQHLLLYEWMPRGNLNRFLYSASEESWPARFKVALGIAKALGYLQHSCQPPISHGSLHPGNVLLDERGEAKLGDVGVTRLALGGSSFQVTQQGVGYAAPELAAGGIAADGKGDVYSFGVLVLELICGKRPMDPSFAEQGVVDLVGWVKARLEEGEPEAALDSKISAAEAKDEMLQIMKVALLCVAEDPAGRPTMAEIVNMLVRARDTAARIKQNPALRDLLV